MLSGLLKRIVILLIVAATLCSLTVCTVAISDNALWEDSKTYVLLAAGGESNSDLCFAAVKVKLDRAINRIYLLFMLEFSEFNDDKLSGVVMDFNNLGKVRVMSDGTADYDSETYFAQLDDELADKNSKNVLIETTVGIKDGLPKDIFMDVNIIDTNGVRSNTLSADMTEEDQSFFLTGEDENNVTEKTKKTAKTKTTKVKSTKPKTTKHRTTKIKTSKTKTDKAEENNDIAVIETESGINSEIGVNNNRRRLALMFGAGAAVVAASAGCAAAIKNKKKHDENRGRKK